ncbi:hypothetical protein SAMN05421796_10633 [Chryseobacterium piscicola]|jgi:hypothetical protein|uniref:SnoaL-like domain-containing protein n=1 Tax=Chryseobacterium piscicola TaxID=551459 RepID=A0A1N7MZ60_9FLAO|nr:hypothetical protein [Chryseobacterium piscicola]PQA93888.1 hypothetical protein B0A70_08880 [Chryseobacterium piscicola]SIS91169.1 hypothetical protein SAMN05421796_10633 [Chryseobacterium piscicola]
MEKVQKGKIEKIEAFLEKWFIYFDQVDESSFLTKYLSEDVKMKFPGNDLFTGHERFNKWFAESKSNLLGNTAHHVSEIKVSERSENQFDISFNVRYVAPMKHAVVNLNLKEDWKLTWDIVKDEPVITEYIVS